LFALKTTTVKEKRNNDDDWNIYDVRCVIYKTTDTRSKTTISRVCLPYLRYVLYALLYNVVDFNLLVDVTHLHNWRVYGTKRHIATTFIFTPPTSYTHK